MPETGVEAGIITTVELVVSTVAVEDSLVAEDAAAAVVVEKAALRGILEGELYHHATSLLTLTKNGHSIFAEQQPPNVDKRLTDTSQDDVVRALSALRIDDTDLPVRKGYGSIGTPVKLRANFFPMCLPQGPLYEYDVAIDPPVSNKHVKRRIFRLAEGTADWANAGLRGTVAHDLSSKLIASRQLPDQLKIVVPSNDKDEEFPHSSTIPAAGLRDQAPPRQSKGHRSKWVSPMEYTLTIRLVQKLETEELVRYVVRLRYRY